MRSGGAALIETAIAANRFLSLLPEKSRETLAQAARLLRFAKAEVIFHEQEAATQVWVVVTGQAKLVKITTAGHELIIELVVSQELFGAVFYHHHPVYPVTAVALEETTVLCFPVAVMQQLLGTVPQLQRALLEDTCRRLCHAQEMRGLALQDVPQRIAWALSYLYEKFGAEIPHGRAIVAELAGTTVETAIRITRRMAAEGILATRRNALTVQRPDRLRESAGACCREKPGEV